MVNYIKRSVLFFLAIVVGASTLIGVLFPNQTSAASEIYRFIDNKTVGAYEFVGADRDVALIRSYVAKSPLVLWNVDNNENEGTYLEAPIASSSNGSICSDRIYFRGTNNMARVTRSKASGACQAAETRTPITVDTANFKKFFTAQANGSLLSINNIPMVRVPSDATIFVENNLSAKCPAMLRKNGNDVWGVIGAEPKAEGTVSFDSEGRTKAYQQYAAAALGEDKFGNCQIGGNDQKSYSHKAAAMLMGGTADKWDSATGGVNDYISIKPGNENHDGMPFGHYGQQFINWGSPIKEYKGTIEAPATNCDVYLDKILRGHCQSGFENNAADYCTNSTNLSFPEPVPTAADRKRACIVGQTIAANGSLDIPEKQDECLADDTTCTAGAASSCVIDGIGWIVCPVLNAIGGVSDAMYGWIESILLLNPLQMNDTNGDPTSQYTAWKSIRDISNVLLVIAFLFIIFSQITSIGVTNYGIKKLLPRVILVAILVNVSFIVMMISIDAVNLIGKGLYDVLVGLAPDVTADSINKDNAIGSFITGILAGTIAGTGVTIAGGIIGAPALALLAVPFIVVAVLALFAAIATLFIRNALVIILVLVAPLAFAAFLLPNTKSLFDRWRKLLVGILFLYPTAALLFGGTKFAAYTLANDDQPLSILVAIFVMAAPLGLLPWLAASSGGILGTIGGKLQGLAKSARSPLQNALKSRVENQRERYQSGQNTLFGRRRTEEQAAHRQSEIIAGRGKRNWGERLSQARTSRDADTANAKTAKVNNVAERGRTGTSRRDRQFGQVAQDSLRQSDQKASLDAFYRQSVDRRIATPGTIDAQREALKTDSQSASKEFQGVTNLRNQQRVRDNVASEATGGGLREESTRTFGLEEDIKATQAEVLAINHESGVADDAVQRQKAANQTVSTLESEQNAVFETENKNDDLAYRKEVADREVKSVADTEKAVYEERLTDAPEVPDDHPLADAIARAKAADTESTVATSRTTRAEAVQKRELNAAIQDSESGLADRMGGVDPEGANLVIAQAIEGDRKADETDIAAYAVRLRDQGVPDIASGAEYDADGNVTREAVISTPDRPSLLGIAMDTARPAAEKEAAGRAIVDAGNIDAIGPYLDYLATERASSQQAVQTVQTEITALQSQAAAEGREPDPAVLSEAQARLQEVSRRFETVQSLQKATGEKIGSSPGKPMGLGAAEIAQLKTGNYVPMTPPVAATNGGPVEVVDAAGNTVRISDSAFNLMPAQREVLATLTPVEMQTLSTVITKGPSADGWAAMDKTDIRTILRLSRAGLIPPDRLASMSETLQLSLHDDRWAGRIQDRERGLLTQLETLLPPPPPRARAPGP